VRSCSYHVQALWDKAMDGNRVTKVEQRTLRRILNAFAFDNEGRTFLEAKLVGLGTKPDIVLPNAEEAEVSNPAALDSNESDMAQTAFIRHRHRVSTHPRQFGHPVFRKFTTSL